MENIVSEFAIEGRILGIEPLGSGLINDTFRVRTDGADDYVLQRINEGIFRDIELLQDNIDRVTAHIRGKLVAAGTPDVERRVLRFIPAKETGKSYVRDAEGKPWRLSVLIRDSFTYDAVTPEYSRHAGRSFGEFESMLVDIPGKLGETIPDFHNMELRLRQLHEAVEADVAGRMSDPEVKAFVEEMFANEEKMTLAERLYREGKLPKRICHCDTKVNNMMFDKDGSILCVIDLDTVMPSYVFSDFGDFMRTGANTVTEDNPDIASVAFRMDIFEAFTRGYLESATFLTQVEKENLPYAALLFPYMQAVRFLTDYLNGDTYYKIAYPEHNLVRTHAQWRLFCEQEKMQDKMANIINRLRK